MSDNLLPYQLCIGYKKFLQKQISNNKDLFISLSELQKPKSMVISCCDSRVNPELIFGCQPGDIFVLRNIANLVPSYDEEHKSIFQGTGAALEFAIKKLKIQHIIVLGHSSCSGVRFFLENLSAESSENSSFLKNWTSQMETFARTHSKNKKSWKYLSIEYSLKNLLTFPFVFSEVKAQKLSLHGAYFNLLDGSLLARNSKNGEFLSPSFIS